MVVVKLSKAGYEAGVCSRRPEAVTVPYIEVSIGDWKPEESDCHNNAKRWVEANPLWEVVTGWISFMWFGPCGVQLTAHSVVRDPDGSLFDITPVANGRLRGGAFVEHHGDPVVFSEMLFSDIRCPSFDPTADAQALHSLLGAQGCLATDSDEVESWP